ncbi:hypothetical protein ACP70R_018993 [Stipagrostis hirtigluma subsp. patula]
MAPQVRRSTRQMEIAAAAHDPATRVAVNGQEASNAAELNPRGPNLRRRGRGVTVNDKLRRLRARGIPLDIQFARQFGKVCGRHASVFKSEITVCIRQEAPLRVKKWKDMDRAFPGAISAMWNFLRDKFPEISVGDYEYVMAQVERQYNVRRHRLYKTYCATKERPSDVAPEDWQWLIDNLWTSESFQKRSATNSQNRGHQEMKSLVGTKSIVQIAYDLRDPETGEWPNAMDVWRAIYQKPDGTWSVPNGEEVLNNLNDVAQREQERISSAPVPLVEHFALVLGRKPNHSRGVGVAAVNQGAQERHRLRAQAETARQHADDAQQHAAALEEEVQRLTHANMQLRDELESQREELASQRKTVEAQNVDMERLVDQKLEERMNSYFARMVASSGVSFSPTSTQQPLHKDVTN